MTQRIIVDSVDSIVASVPAVLQRHRVLQSATIRHSTPARAVATTGDAAPVPVTSVDTLTTTTAADLFRGDTGIELADATDVEVGRKYVLDVLGSPLTVLVTRVAGNHVDIGSPLTADISSGASFNGTTITHALTTVDTDLIGTGIAHINVAFTDGYKTTFTHAFRIVRDAVAYSLDGSRLPVLAPEVYQYQTGSDRTFDETIEAAWAMHVEPWLNSRGFEPSRIRTWPGLEAPHAAACVLLLMDASGTNVQDEERRVAKHKFLDLMETCVESRNFFYEEDDTRSRPPDEFKPARAAPRWSR